MAYSRTNNATDAEINRDEIFASGTFKDVWQGVYTEGERKGERCVIKEFKTGSVYEEHYFEEELNTISRTQKIIDDFAAAGVIHNARILLNTPEIWTSAENGRKVLIEPMIENFEKFNSNSGWVLGQDETTGGTLMTENSWGDAMQALSHFSYHDSLGKFLLCDLQGGSYQDGYILTDPAIMSQLQNCGPADLGPDGIRSFFQRHRCGRFCSRRWSTPTVIGEAVFPLRQGTSMVRLPVRASRNPLTTIREN